MLIAPLRNSVTMSAWQKSSACSTSIASPASSLSPPSEGYLGIIAPSSYACDGVKKNSVRGLWRSPVSPLRQTASASPRPLLRRQARLLGLRRATRRLLAVPGREERRPRMVGGQSAVHQTIRLL